MQIYPWNKPIMYSAIPYYCFTPCLAKMKLKKNTNMPWQTFVSREQNDSPVLMTHLLQKNNKLGTKVQKLLIFG